MIPAGLPFAGNPASGVPDADSYLGLADETRGSPQLCPMDAELIERLKAGYGLYRSGQPDASEQLYREVLAQDPDNVHALNLLGVLCVNTGRAADAIPLIERAISATPDDAEAWSNLGLALKDTRSLPRAVEAFSRAADLSPDNAAVLNRLANALAEMGRVDDSVKVYRRALQRTPDFEECRINLSNALLNLGDLSGASEAIEHVLRLNPRSAKAHNIRGEVLARRFRYEEAILAYRRALQLQPGYPVASINLAVALKDVGEVGEARHLLEEVTARQPGNAHAQTSLGALCAQLGEFSAAAACFRLALAHDPRYPQAYYQLSQLKAFGLTPAETAAARTLVEDATLRADDRAPLYFALAAAADSAGDIEGGFRYLDQAQQIKGQNRPYDDRSVARYYASIKKAFPTAEVPLNPPTIMRPRPVFILGMPRSGTSLTEQILASHPQAKGAGEVSFIDDALEEVARMTGTAFPAGFRQLSVPQRLRLGNDYLARMVRRNGTAEVLVDKTPMNFQYIGFIAAILPGARFIHCTRDPLDNCLSIFKLPFDEGHSYAHDLEALGRFYLHYVDLMAHWTRLFPGRIGEFGYEDTVADVEGQARRLLEFVGLDYLPAVTAFHQTARIVRTPSASQVRQPIYRTSVRSWTRYRAHLGPLFAALGRDPDAQ